MTPPAYGTFGNVGKNIFRDTPFRNWDVSVQKNWKFKERLNAQFRAEFFNVLNHPLFADVGSGHLAANDPSQQIHLAQPTQPRTKDPATPCSAREATVTFSWA